MYGGFAKYVSVAEKKEKAKKMIKKLEKKGKVSPVLIEGRTIAKNWWGKAWNKNMESYSDFSNRISRGRAYVTHGSVVDLKINGSDVDALVLGSGSKPYKVHIKIKPLLQKTWELITKDCVGKIDTLSELVDGKFPKALADLFTAKGDGIFPAPKEISFTCDCPDSAKMCKHIAATLYGIGARIDKNPKLFFELREVNIDDIISSAVKEQSDSLLKKATTKSSRVIDNSDVDDLFDLD